MQHGQQTGSGNLSIVMFYPNDCEYFGSMTDALVHCRTELERR